MKKNKYIFKNGLIDLAQPRLGSKVVFKTDEFFALANRIINSLPPIFKEGVFDAHGKWMDGWETRRKRKKGHDYLIVKLGKPGRIYKVDVDTSFFNGNQPTHVSLEACFSKNNIPSKKIKWNKILNNKKIKANSHHLFNIKNKTVFSHIKLNIFPDGGVARLRVYGSIDTNKVKFNKKIINLTSVLNGASIIACNNEHFGRAENILAPGVGKNMGDGWETRRSRGKNFDWLILKCATAGKVKKIQIDTHHFKGNYPDACTLQAAHINKNKSPKAIVANSKKWKFLLSKVKLEAHKKHNFQNTLMKNTKINYVKINIFPDGGISRIRLFGDPK
jgi:allantoicase